MNAGTAKVICFADFQLDLRAGELSRNGIRIKVPLQSIQLLELLVKRAGEVVTREELQKKLWPNSTIVEFEHSINAAMNRLRQALSDSAESPRFIETLPKRGYRFMVSVEWVQEKAVQAQASGDRPGSISPGQVLADRFRIVRLAGRGGMGEVYEAHDTRLDRRVALKFLPDEFVRDPKALERFDGEARAIAALNHPHICTVYDTGTHENWPFIVMEYVEGETLAARLSKGALSSDQVLRYAIEIADALDQAHRSGVVHRDLKPGNIMLTKTGVKVLDFGLAKRRVPHAVAGETSLPSGNTAEGAILGTFQYMAPEQLEGKEADARSDIFVFGVVVYEMATGRKAFEGESQASVVAAILQYEPAPITECQLPPLLDRVLRACLSKDPNDRCQSARDLCNELRWISEESTHVAAVAKKRVPSAWVLASGACVLAVLPLGIMYLQKSPVSRSAFRFQIYPPEKTTLSIPNGPAALSPDGKHLAFAAGSTETGQSLLWVRRLDTLAAKSLAGTDGARCPFWSFDGRYLGFFADGKLKKIAISGGPPQPLCDAGGLGPGGSWNQRGTILFATDRGLESVADTGGRSTLGPARKPGIPPTPIWMRHS